MVTLHSGSRASRAVDGGTRRAEITEAGPSSWMRGPAPATVFALARSRPPILHLWTKRVNVNRMREDAICCAIFGLFSWSEQKWML